MKFSEFLENNKKKHIFINTYACRERERERKRKKDIVPSSLGDPIFIKIHGK